MRRRRLHLLLALVLAATPAVALAAGTDEVVVTGADGDDVAAAVAAAGGSAAQVVEADDGRPAVVAAALTPAQQRDLAADPRVATLEPDLPVELEATQSPAPWQLDRLDQPSLPLSSTYSWEEDGTGVVVYVVDTGVRSTHEEFGGRVAAGHSEVAGGTEDCHGHGTRVASLVAGTTFGAAKGATIVPVRVFDCAGSSTLSTLLAGLAWVLDTHPPGTPGVVNLSLSTAGSAVLDDAAQQLLDHGLTVVAAAGNQAGDACLRSPARVPGVVTVASAGDDDQLAPSSNRGACVDVVAGGAGVAVAAHTADDATTGDAGTSMAAGVASGVAARALDRPGHDGAGGGAVGHLLVAEAVPGPVGLPLLQAPASTPAPSPALPVGLVHTGASATGPDRTAAPGGCVGAPAGTTLTVGLAPPPGTTLDRVLVDASGGTARLRAATATSAGFAQVTLATVAGRGATATAWPAGAGAAWIEWTTGSPADRLCLVRVVARTGIDDAGLTSLPTAPCAVLDTRGGATPPSVAVDVTACAPDDVAALDLHVVAFGGSGPVRLTSGGIEHVVERAGRVSRTLRVAVTDGTLRVEPGDGDVRLVVVGALVPTPLPPAPTWTAPTG